MIKRAVLFVALWACGGAYAADYQVGQIIIEHPWARPTSEGVKIGAAYLSIANKGNSADKLVSVSSPIAGKVQIHQTTDENGVMKMHEVRIELAPGAIVDFKPGGYHIMLLDLKQKLEEGHPILLTLSFEKAGSIDVKADVEKSGEATDGMEHMHHHMH